MVVSIGTFCQRVGHVGVEVHVHLRERDADARGVERFFNAERQFVFDGEVVGGAVREECCWLVVNRHRP